MKKVLVIAPFDSIYPPMNGGMQRCFHIIHQLAIHFDLTIIINQRKKEFISAVNEYPAIIKVKVLSTCDTPYPKDVFSILPQKLKNALRYRWYKKKIKGPADGNFLKYYSLVKKCVKDQYFDTIILESPATLNATSLVREYDKSVKIIFDAHNVETNLGAVFLDKKEITRKRYLAIRKSESSLHTTVDAILTCSIKDKNDFLKLNKGNLLVSVIPNGVGIDAKLHDDGVRLDKPSFILFCGYLSSKPNSEGLFWFHQSIWPKVKAVFPELKLLVLGSGNLPSSMDKLLKDESLIYTGKVQDVRSFYNQATLSIVPLKTGSGTRLKILESMSYGLPVISTAQGAEGIEYTDGLNILIADNENCFVEGIIHLLNDKEQRLNLQQSARELVEKNYSWDIIGNALAEFINNG